MTELKECPFCGKKDELEITWEEWVGFLNHPDLRCLRYKPRGQGDFVSIRCDCGAALTRAIDGINIDLWDRIGMDAEISDDMIEDELIRIWNRDKDDNDL